MALHARVAVIGGGIYGCGLLYHLVEKGWRDVVLIEKNELTAGSTWHAAGFCTHYTFNLTHGFMRKYSTELYRRLEEELGEPTGYHRCRGIRATSDPDRMAEFRHGLSVGRQLGIDFEILSPAEMEQVFPLMSTHGMVGGILEPIDGYVDPTQATQAMARCARAGGARVLRNNPVTAIESLSSGEWKLTTPEQEVIAEHIVIAAGFWANEVGRLIGLDLPIVPMLHQYLVTEDSPAVKACEPDSIPLVRFHDAQWYVRRERDGLILGAYESEPQTWSIDGIPPEFGMELLPADLDRIEHLMLDAIERIPVLGEAGIKTVVHGPISYTPDGQPLIGPAPGLRNAWIAAGSGFGIGEGAGAGKLLAEWMIEGAPPMHMFSFDPRRFGAFADRDFSVAKAIEVFAMQFATHYPFEEREAARKKKTTPIYDRLAANGAVFGVAYGWERANWFAKAGERQRLSFERTEWFERVAEECRALNEAVGVIDFTGFTKYVVRGKKAEAFLDSLSANRLPAKVGELRLCHFLNARGGIECEFTITRLAKHEWYLVCAAVAERHHLDWLTQHRPDGLDIEIENLTQIRAVLGIAGPRSRDLLQTLTEADLSNQAFPWLSARQIEVAGIEVDALRVSYTGELGWELHHPIEHQALLYDAIKNKGEPLGLVDVGFYAVDSMRLEKGYRAWGVELTIESTPLEAGLQRFVVTKDREFIGRDGLRAELAASLKRSIVFVEVDAVNADAFGGETIFDGEQIAGVMVSGGYGHRVRKSIGFALLDITRTEIGTALEVEILGERRPIRVAVEPAYDPGNQCPRTA